MAYDKGYQGGIIVNYRDSSPLTHGSVVDHCTRVTAAVIPDIMTLYIDSDNSIPEYVRDVERKQVCMESFYPCV